MTAIQRKVRPRPLDQITFLERIKVSKQVSWDIISLYSHQDQVLRISLHQAVAIPESS